MLILNDPVSNAAHCVAGAICEPEKIQPSMPKPADFDAYWQGQKSALEAMQMDAQLTLIASLTDSHIEAYSIVLNCITGSHVRGYFAKPKGAGPFPAYMEVIGAGVMTISAASVVSRARNGVMAIHINAHDIENGQPESYYASLRNHELKQYPSMGRDSRDPTYFRRMFCACYQAARYVTGHPNGMASGLWSVAPARAGRSHLRLRIYVRMSALLWPTCRPCAIIPDAKSGVAPAGQGGCCMRAGRPIWPSWKRRAIMIAPISRAPSAPKPWFPLT